MISSVTFGTWLKQQRQLHHLTQQELSGQVGCAAETLRKIEADRRTPSSQLVIRLLKALDIPQNDQSAIIDWACTGARTSTLPHQLTPVLGRDEDIAAIAELLQQYQVRLVTLIGAPGVGKTRLAQAVAAKIEPYLFHQVTYVPLAAVHNPELILSTIVHTLNITTNDTRSTFDVLVEYLQKSPRLLVLDNMEHLIAATPILHNLLHIVPQIKILVTSRVVLKLTGEHVYSVVPLSLPPTQIRCDVVELQNVPSIRLFVERTQARNPHFRLTDTNAPVIAQLCTQLDGLPLALELAAMRTIVLSPAELLLHLDQRFALLGARSQDGPDHRRTLRTTIDWSVKLLSTAEQHLFAQLSVFRGTFTRPAIEAICGTDEDTVLDIHDQLTTLVDHSLVQIERDHGEEPRFSLLEVLRQHASEQLTSDEVELLCQKHAVYYLSLTTQTEQALEGNQAQEWLQLLEIEIPNIRAALEWSKTNQQAEIGVTLLAHLWRFWLMRGYLNEGRQWMDSLLTFPGEVDPTIHAEAYGGAGVLAQIQGDSDKALQFHEQSLTFALKGEKTQIIGRAINRLGILWLKQQNYDKAKRLFEKGLSILQESGDTLGVAYLLNNMGNIDNEQGHLQQAQHLYQKSYMLFEKEQCVDGMALSLINQGEIAALVGDDIQAQKLYSQSLTYYQALQDDRNIAICHLYLGQIYCRRGDYIQSFDYAHQSLSVLYQINDIKNTLRCIQLIAAITNSINNQTNTIRLLGAAEALCTHFGLPFTPTDYAGYDHVVVTHQPHFNAVEREIGRSMSLEEAVTYALQQRELFYFPKQERSLVCPQN